MKSRLVKFLLLLLLILGAFEVFVRMNARNFHAFSDKLLLKVALLERNPETKVLFLGTSRFLDAIEDRQFTTEIERLTGREIVAMNAATTGSQGARFAYFARIAAENAHLTHVILEASPPALHDGDLNFPDAITPDVPAEEEGATFATRIENKLQRWVTGNVAIAKYRKTLRPATLQKFVVLHTADIIPPNAWARKGIVRNLFVKPDVALTEEIAAEFQAEIIRHEEGEAPPRRLRRGDTIDNLNRISEIFASSDIEVIWVAPPVSKAEISDSHNPKLTDYYRDIALRFGSDFYDYAGSAIDDEFLRDPTHLNANGRFVFTTMLARALADRIVAGSE